MLERLGIAIAQGTNDRRPRGDARCAAQRSVPIDLDVIRSRQLARLAGEPPASNEPSVEDDLQSVLDAARQYVDEAERLGALTNDLQASAELWARLYEANVRRANRAEAERVRLTEALDRAPRPALVAEALEALVRTCQICARGRLPRHDEPMCSRCAEAMDVLASTNGRAR